MRDLVALDALPPELGLLRLDRRVRASLPGAHVRPLDDRRLAHQARAAHPLRDVAQGRMAVARRLAQRCPADDDRADVRLHLGVAFDVALPEVGLAAAERLGDRVDRQPCDSVASSEGERDRVLSHVQLPLDAGPLALLVEHLGVAPPDRPIVVELAMCSPFFASHQALADVLGRLLGAVERLRTRDVRVDLGLVRVDLDLVLCHELALGLGVLGGASDRVLGAGLLLGLALGVAGLADSLLLGLDRPVALPLGLEALLVGLALGLDGLVPDLPGLGLLLFALPGLLLPLPLEAAGEQGHRRQGADQRFHGFPPEL